MDERKMEGERGMQKIKESRREGRRTKEWGREGEREGEGEGEGEKVEGKIYLRWRQASPELQLQSHDVSMLNLHLR